ncbi:MAG: hypothetical protein B7Z73_17060, partial [Planctomycetia bacterium 21-64-5]
MAVLFAEAPDCLHRTIEVADRCAFSLDELRYEYPEELCPAGSTPLSYLIELTWQGAARRYPAGVPDKVRALIEHELKLIAELRYEAYFLTVWDLVRFARSQGILCQGRGSAANSAVCYCLGVTAVDPERMDVLFERFISRERNEAPDIDVDFEHERREEVIQYVYDKYGRDRAGMTAEVITYRFRSAVRDVGKALGFSPQQVDGLAKLLDAHGQQHSLDRRSRQAGLDPASPDVRRLIALVHELVGFPRHLSQHVGGMVMTRGPLLELVPIENAAMPDRTVIQWDKDDLDELGMPPVLKDIVMTKRGLVIVVGGTGSGKSTTLAGMIGHRNQNSYGHIITIEDPVEYVHEHNHCIITHREVGVDTESWHNALKNTLRQAPDVILIGEIRDAETMEYAVAFAETGHLCLATLHANSANQALDRIINFFPEERRNQLLLDLSLNLRAFISQRLIQTVDGKRCAAIEI